ncbi:hypothetical protein ACHAXT_005562 [Thalassiosira profunda]
MSTMDDDPAAVESADDKRAKKALLLETIANRCSTSSPHKILQQIHAAISSDDGSQLDATILSGGYTNYSFKVYVDKHPELRVFAKFCFEFALWNPDKTAHYDLKRTENEYAIMKTISDKTPGCVVSPLACWDVQHDGQKMKLLVTEWSAADEQFSNQFLDGEVDPRIAPKIASTLAALHCIDDFDPDFNELVKPCMENLLEHMKSVAGKAANTTSPKDRTEAHCVELGEDTLRKVMEANIANYHRRDCLIHSDSHVFNILVEAKPSIEHLETFGPNGTMILCDWEMAMAGPMGRDVGLALSFPIGCMIAHALEGHAMSLEGIEMYVRDLIDAYCAEMEKAGKTPEEVSFVVRNIVGWCGWFQYLAFYILNCQGDLFPVENEESVPLLRDAVGVLGLKYLRLSYDTEYVPASTGVDEIRRLFDSLWREEVALAREAFASRKRKMRPRKSSLLRTANRRVSDTGFLFAADSVRNLSIREEAVGEKRPSLAAMVSESMKKLSCGD